MSRRPKRKKRKRRFPWLLFIIAVLALMVWDSNTRLVTDSCDIKLDGLSEDFDGFRIVQISDTHAARFGDGNEKLFRAVAVAKPDIIAVTGDLLTVKRNGEYDPAQLDAAMELMDGLTDIAPVYFVTGNHDWASGDIIRLLEGIEESGAHILRNSFVTLQAQNGGQLVLAGVDDPNGPADMLTPEGLMEEIEAEEPDLPVILLAHRNNRAEDYAACGYDLILCGHGHGGVVRLPFVGGVFGMDKTFFPEYDAGLFDIGHTQLMVSRGLGNSVGIRFLNNPEIVAVDLRS
ncbi:MAG: metallophosphoesterase [Oscillospiraceae bacterium]|nr:metallophosphoesterase [Oscillospiraceae bacterium]